MTQTAPLRPQGGARPYSGAIISAESYVAEPPDLWLKRLPHSWQQQGPRVGSGVLGDQFEIARSGCMARSHICHVSV